MKNILDIYEGIFDKENKSAVGKSIEDLYPFPKETDIEYGRQGVQYYEWYNPLFLEFDSFKTVVEKFQLTINEKFRLPRIVIQVSTIRFDGKNAHFIHVGINGSFKTIFLRCSTVIYGGSKQKAMKVAYDMFSKFKKYPEIIDILSKDYLEKGDSTNAKDDKWSEIMYNYK